VLGIVTDVRRARLFGVALAMLLNGFACSRRVDPPAPVEVSRLEADEADARAITSDHLDVADHMQVHLNLQSLLHLADVDSGGLFVDFGTPARMKYTNGHWKTGWGLDGTDGEVTYTPAIESVARVYLPLASSEAGTLRVRVKRVGSTTLQPFLNNQALAYVALDRGRGFAEYDFPVPQGVAHAGENELLLRFGEFERESDEDAFAEVDYIRMLPSGVPLPLTAAADADPSADLPRYDRLVRDLVAGGYKRSAITLNAPASLTYYVDVPKGAKLSLRAGAPSGKVEASVRVTPEAGRSTELWRGALTDGWLVQQVPLDMYAGSVVKLEIRALGEGVAGFASPLLLVPETPAEVTALGSKPKNAIVLLVDTLRSDRLHAYNPHTRVHTPVLDAFAAQGAVFENAQSPENWTKPAVASVLTGLYPMSHGVKGGESQLANDAVLIGEVLKQARFATATFIANGYISDRFGFNQGWDYYKNYIRERHTANAENLFRDAANWIEAHKGERFFLYVQTIDPHVPYDPPQEFLDLYQTEPYTGPIRPRATSEQLERAKLTPPKLRLNEADRAYLEALYDAEVTYHDRAFGAFIERLKRLGVYDKTLIVFTADHGEEFYDHKSWGHGHTVYQELLSVPLVLRHPASIKPQRVHELASTVDVAPTVLSSMGLAVPNVMEGVDRIPQLLGAAAPGLSVAFSDFFDDRRVVRAGRYKLILRGLTPTLFDLVSDPHEHTELDVKAHAIALRYCRILLGTFLGARDRGDWSNPDPPGRSVVLKGELAEVDDITRGGLRAIGYAN